MQKKIIEELPAVPSHYCLRESTRFYLPQELKNVSNLYRIYSQKCDEESKDRLLANAYSEISLIKIITLVFSTKHESRGDEITEEDKTKLKKHKEEKKATCARFK